MPGAYLAAILISAAGIAVLDRRWRLAFWSAPRVTAVAIALGTAFFLAWDAVGIASGVFVIGESPLMLGILLAPHLPLEEPFFLAFLSYLALVVFSGARRVIERGHADADAPREADDR
jgi:lycopene cyclase domain-containing protein